MTVSTLPKPLVLPDAAPVLALDVWRGQAEAATDIAARVIGTAFVPESLNVYEDERRTRLNRDATLAQVTAALLTGQELGLNPMASLRSIDVIKGTPALRAVAMRALVMRDGHEMWLVESTKTRCIYQGTRAGSAHVQESVWTFDRAKDLGLTGKPNWRTQPAAMLIARATAECARLVAPDSLLGLPYTAEELADDADTALAPAEPAKPPSTRRRRAVITAGAIAPERLPIEERANVVDTPALDDWPPPEPPEPFGPETAAPESTESHEPEPPGMTTAEPPAEDFEPLTAAQRRTILMEYGGATREERLAGVAAITGREVESLNDLTRAEASEVIERLRGPQ